MSHSQTDSAENTDVVNAWWKRFRPYWHILSFLVIMTFLATMNWAKVAAYDGRLLAIETWQHDVSTKQEQQGQDIAVMKQQVLDIHEYLLPRK